MDVRTEQIKFSREQRTQMQLRRLNQTLAEVMPVNRYYQEKFGCKQLQVSSLQEWSQLPLSTKADWLGEDASGLARHHSYPETRYRRYHRTSGTKGRPMVILDTEQDWEWWIKTWQYVLDASGIESHDRIMMAFSFGPFIGFWSAHDACLSRGCMVIPCGGMSTAARIDMIQTSRPTVLFSTPSYALHLARDAVTRGISLDESSIRQVFVAGEPGGCIPSIRRKIEQAFGASVMDHAGATEVGPWGFGATDGLSLHVIESEFIAEFLPTEKRDSMNEGASDLVELVLTSLGRCGAPVFRYQTGDLVRPSFENQSSCTFVRLEGGVIGRADDMLVVRGVNVFPSSVDAIVRSFQDITEYRLTVTREQASDTMTLECEVESDAVGQAVAEQLSEKLAVQLNLRFEVVCVATNSLPRSEGKSRRVFDLRKIR